MLHCLFLKVDVCVVNFFIHLNSCFVKKTTHMSQMPMEEHDNSRSYQVIPLKIMEILELYQNKKTIIQLKKRLFIENYNGY